MCVHACIREWAIESEPPIPRPTHDPIHKHTHTHQALTRKGSISTSRWLLGCTLSLLLVVTRLTPALLFEKEDKEEVSLTTHRFVRDHGVGSLRFLAFSSALLTWDPTWRRRMPPWAHIHTWPSPSRTTTCLPYTYIFTRCHTWRTRRRMRRRWVWRRAGRGWRRSAPWPAGRPCPGT